MSAAGAIAVSTSLLAVGGVAQAAGDWTFSTDTLTPTGPGQFQVTVPDGICGIDWTLVGGQGGSDQDAVAGTVGGEYEVTTAAQAGQVIDLFPGSAGLAGAAGAAGGSNAFDTGASGAAGTGSGGGGGAATIVYSAAGQYGVYAYGGDGAGTGGGAGGGDEDNVGDWAPGSVTDEGYDGPARTRTGSGVVTGTGIPCPVAPTPPAPEVEQPGTPTVNWISAGNKSATMQIWAGYVPEDAASTPVYEYSLDGGAWKKLATSREFQIEPTITGLVNGTTYAVRVRVTVDGVSSDATAGQSVTPYQPLGAPGNVAVTFGAASTTITWTAPVPVAGAPAVDGYDVGFSGGEYGDNLCTTAATVLTCTVTDTDWYPGHTYTFSVTPVDAAGNRGESGRVEAVAPFPATVPTSDGPLTNAGSSTSLNPGQSITISGTGYMPFSTVTVVVYSTPTVLGTAEADENGAFTFTGKLPEGLAAGSHTLVAAGVDADGDPYHLTQAITVGGGGADSLPNTGASVALPALGGLAALAMGGGLLFAARRRSAA